MYLNYRLIPRSRVSAGRGAEVQEFRPIYHVLPGTTIRGALGAAWWHDPASAFEPSLSSAARQGVFDRLFSQLVVHEAKPSSGVRLRALSQLVVKYPGPDVQVAGQHDLARGALDLCPVCSEPLPSTRGWTGLDGATSQVDRCAHCLTVFEMERGGWAFDGEVATVTRTALDGNGVAKESALFRRPALEKSVVFNGSLQVRDPSDIPSEALEWLKTEMPLSVGGQRSTLGRVWWSTEKAHAPILPQADPVVLRLCSPAILLDSRGLPTLDLAGHLSAMTGAGELACHPWTRAVQVSTWHSMAGIPKPVEWALEVGTTAVLRGWSDDALQRLARGIGIRQLEGFGHVVLLDPVDLQSFETSPPAEKVEASDHVSALLSMTASRRQRNTVNGLLKVARRVDARRRSGVQQGDLEAMVAETLTYAWAQDLGSDARDEIGRLLRSAELPTIITQLIAWRAQR